jgi:hypothetical protein
MRYVVGSFSYWLYYVKIKEVIMKLTSRFMLIVLVIFLIGILIGLSFDNACADIAFNRGETELLNLAYREGIKVEQPEALQAIMLNETVAGRWGRHGDKNFKNWKRQCYGVMQIQFLTAELVVKNWTSYDLTGHELRIRLQYDDAFNVEIARKYLNYLLSLFKGNLSKAILAYNVGPGNVQKNGLKHDPNGYLKRARKYIGYVVKFNRSQGNGMIIEYEIVKGDTLFKIAAKLLYDGWRYKEITLVNPDVKPRSLKIGSTIFVVKK